MRQYLNSSGDVWDLVALGRHRECLTCVVFGFSRKKSESQKFRGGQCTTTKMLKQEADKDAQTSAKGYILIDGE